MNPGGSARWPAAVEGPVAQVDLAAQVELAVRADWEEARQPRSDCLPEWALRVTAWGSADWARAA
jgi:hypothetical protein